MDPLRLVDELSRAIELQDADRVAEVLHPDVELHLYSGQGVITGREQARAWYRESFTSRILFEGHAEPDAESDGSIVMRGNVRWYDESGLRDRPGRWRVTFRDGLIASITAEET